jgi:hypothetical protein
LNLLAQPGIQARDLLTVVPVSRQREDPGDEDSSLVWLPAEQPMRVFSRKLTSSEAFNQGKTQLTTPYTLYADHRRGTTFPLTTRMRLWHPKASSRNPDGTPDYETALDIQSITEYDTEGVAIIEAYRAQ